MDRYNIKNKLLKICSTYQKQPIYIFNTNKKDIILNLIKKYLLKIEYKTI